MYYLDTLENSFRLGDVLKGFITVSPRIKEPLLGENTRSFDISVEYPQYSVILSPCCSIGESKICITPLIRVRKDFFKNPYFAEDLTRINKRMRPELASAPAKWAALTAEQRAERQSKDYVYTMIDLFIYDSHDYFKAYEIRVPGGDVISTRCYMIDFRSIYKVDCEKIETPDKVPIEAKCLQLSETTREDLRAKIAYYYTRP